MSVAQDMSELIGLSRRSKKQLKEINLGPSDVVLAQSGIAREQGQAFILTASELILTGTSLTRIPLTAVTQVGPQTVLLDDGSALPWTPYVTGAQGRTQMYAAIAAQRGLELVVEPARAQSSAPAAPRLPVMSPSEKAEASRLAAIDDGADRAVVVLADGLRDLLLGLVLFVTSCLLFGLGVVIGFEHVTALSGELVTTINGFAVLLALIAGVLALVSIVYLFGSVTSLREGLKHLKLAAALRAAAALEAPTGGVPSDSR